LLILLDSGEFQFDHNHYIVNMRLKHTIIIFLLFADVCVSGQTIKIMTYNIRYDNPQDGVNAWPSRKDKVFDLLKKYDPDILGIQEALQHQISDIIVALPGYAFIGVGRDDGKAKGEYSAILYKKSKFSIIDQNTFWLSLTPGVPGSKSWDAAITRVATWAKIKDEKSGKEFLVLNTHFDHIGKEARKNSAEILRQRSTEFGSIPIVVTGDFNCTRTEDPYQVMVRNDGVVLHDPAPRDAPGTFCNFAVNSMTCNPIDYIFHSGQWKSSDYKVITDNDGKHYPSDHLPVMVTLTLIR
jgi:endonuclease/exonuclease/phosphatase family metal-dependent hydrolase